jgi:SRSO17 transposase
MDAQTILDIKPALREFLCAFRRCMGYVGNNAHLETYVCGQLGPLERKSVEPIALAAGVPPRTLQEFLGLFKWNESAVRDVLQRRVAAGHAHPHSVGIIDETSFAKKGNKTACVQRQHCGCLGKTENCMVSVHLGYAAGDFHTLLDGEPFLPEETWHADRPRCRAAGIPDQVVYRAKWQIALGQLERANANGVRFAWLTFDEYYGGKPPFLRELDARGQNYVGEVPSSFYVWTREPEALHRTTARTRKRDRPKLKVRNLKATSVAKIAAHSPVLRAAPWQHYRIRDGTKGPMVGEAKCIPVWIKDENGLPGRPHHLLVARNIDDGTLKYFLSNAPPQTAVETLLLVAFSRHRVERMFEDSKTELGLDHFEVRRYRAICRHLILGAVSHLFLAEFHAAVKKTPRADGAAGADGDLETGAGVEPRGPLFASVG